MIRRTPLRDEVRRIVRDWIVEGRLPAGTRIEEPAVAAELGVSRTPLREALFDLERDGFIESEMGRGFRVAPLGVGLVEEAYPILGALEAAAVRLAAERVIPKIGSLRRLNSELRACGDDFPRVYELDRQWHATLIQPCPNARMREMISNLTQLVRRFDGACERGLISESGSCDDHDAVADALEQLDFAGASQRLEQHWLACVAPVSAWIRSHEPSA